MQPRDQLFATLDVTMHAGRLPNSVIVLYADTIGFISDIPTNLIESFAAVLEDVNNAVQFMHHQDTHTHNRFTALFPGPPGRAAARRELLDFVVQGKINRGRHTDHPVGRHSIRTKQCPPPPSPFFYGLIALPAAQPTVSKHHPQLVVLCCLLN